MIRYVIPIVMLTFFVDLLLLISVGKILGVPVKIIRILGASMASGLFSGLWLLPGFLFMKSGLWRMVQLCCVIVMAYGIHPVTVRQGFVFLLLKFALQGASGMLGSGSILSVILSVAGIVLLWVFGMNGLGVDRELVPVELCHGDRWWKLTALRDTGNTLRDPLTGERVIVAGADMGQKLLGLTQGQLSDPAKTLASGMAPGMRLIPYRTIGQRGAMMLGMRINDVKIGSWQGSAIVAFAPECIGSNEGYQMLIGGCFG